MLQAMHRGYTREKILQLVHALRTLHPLISLSTDIIVGYPGETEEDHRETLAFLRRCAFSELHVFPYSRRPGTPADRLPDQLTHAVKNRRAHEAKAVSEETGRTFLDASVGQVLPVLFESNEVDGSLGHSDTYLYVRVPEPGLRGRLRNVQIRCIEDGCLVGDPIS